MAKSLHNQTKKKLFIVIIKLFFKTEKIICFGEGFKI